MFDNLNVRNKFLAVAAVPTVILLATAVAAIAIADAPELAAMALAGVLLTIAAAVMVAKGMTQRLDSVVTSVEMLSSIRLAALAKHAAGHNPSTAPLPPPSGEAIIEGDDEVGRLARSLATIEPKALELINSRRETTSQNFGAVINRLASRTQVLLDEQIGFIDWLEATEEDADRLEQLFQLDHLATRMRRICESIIVLAGTGDIPGRDQPASLLDVLRVAIADNPRYLDISIRSGDDVDIVGPVACDLAHLVSELLSNATAFSPDDQTVELHATALADGTYRISVIDHGVGMDEQRLASANHVIAAPPDIDLSLDDSFGLIVVGRLARRIGATVQLSATTDSGVTVEVLLPASAIFSAEQPTVVDDTTDPGQLEQAPTEQDPTEQDPADRVPDHDEPTAPAGTPFDTTIAVSATTASEPVPEEQADVWLAPSGRMSSTLAEALPAIADFDASVDSLLTGSAGAEPAAFAFTPGDDDVWTPPAIPDRATAPPLVPPALAGPGANAGVDTGAGTGPDATTDISADAGARSRTGDVAAERILKPADPQPAPQSSATGMGLTRRRRTTAGPDGRAVSPPNPLARASARKPEEVRSMITRYRDGLKGTETPADD